MVFNDDAVDASLRKSLLSNDEEERVWICNAESFEDVDDGAGDGIRFSFDRFLLEF